LIGPLSDQEQGPTTRIWVPSPDTELGKGSHIEEVMSLKLYSLAPYPGVGGTYRTQLQKRKNKKRNPTGRFSFLSLCLFVGRDVGRNAKS
jgi:hypothetical protein